MSLPWYKWFVSDWRNSETRFRLSLAERGLYRELLDLHHAEGSIPSDKTTLRLMVGATAEDFDVAWANVAPLFHTHKSKPGRLVNDRALSVIAESEKYQKAQRVNGSRGGRPKKTQPKPMGFENETQKKARARASESESDTDVSTSNEVDTPKPPSGALSPPAPKRQVFGEFGWVQLSEQEVQKLHDRVGIETAADYAARFDQWVEEAPNAKHSGVRRKDRNAYASILNWIDRDQKEGKHDPRTKRQRISDADDIAILGAIAKRRADRLRPAEVAKDLPDLRPGDEPGASRQLLRIVGGSS